MRYNDFEQQLLDLAMRTKEPLTPAFVAYNLRIRIEEAREHLEKMAQEGNVSLESDADGNLYYDFPALPRGAVRPPPAPVPVAVGSAPVAMYGSAPGSAPVGYAPSQGQALVPGGGAGYPVPARPAPTFSPAVAGLLSFLWPGAGQIYRGEVGAGIGFMIATLVGYVLFIVPGLVMHIISVVNAARAPDPPPAPYLPAPAPAYYLPPRDAPPAAPIPPAPPPPPSSSIA
ncbi:MAG TPA: hypothetical protein VG389_19385 [Myxococcota bacterium]|jgi:hypothetical protein|nr:hypothetical protein [Myxococcota bacterium]